MKLPKTPNKQYYTIHGDKPSPFIYPENWLENDENCYIRSHKIDELELRVLDKVKTSRWLANLDGHTEVGGSLPHWGSISASSSKSGSSLLPSLVNSPTKLPLRSPVKSPIMPKYSFLHSAYRSTIPKATHPRTRPTLPASFFSDSLVCPSTPQSDQRLPDRFIPMRDSPATTPRSEMYRLAKAPHELTTSERILRHRGDTPDPFVPSLNTFQQGDPGSQSTEEAASRPSTSSSIAPTILNSIPTNVHIGDTNRWWQRQVSYGSAWSVGGIAPQGRTFNRFSREAREAGDYFHNNPTPEGADSPIRKRPKDSECDRKHRDRLASALEIDRANRVLCISNKPISSPGYTSSPMRRRSLGKNTHWIGHKWERYAITSSKIKRVSSVKIMPSSPTKVLDAPGLRDDFYCSVLAFCSNCDTLAMGLGNTVYGYSPRSGAAPLNAGIPGEDLKV